MHRTTRLKITDLNPHVICVLCGGYFVDASTIIECLHSFCKTCILRYLETSKLCPICDVMVHKTRPHQNIRADKTLQDLVFKLVPGLYKNEMKRRRIFYTTSPTKDAPKAPSEARGDEMAERFIYTADENISLSLEYCQDGIPDPEVLRRMRQENLQKELTDTKNGGKRDIRYLQCPAAVTVGHLKKFLRLKYDLPSNYVLDVFHTDETLRDYYSLMDIAYIYTWRRRGPLKLYYTIYERSLKRSLVSSTTQESDISSEIPAKSAKKTHGSELEMTKSETAKPSSDSKVKDTILSKEKSIMSSKEKSIFCSKEKSIVCAKEKSVCAKDKVVCAKEKSSVSSKGQMSVVSKTNHMTNSYDNMRSTEPKHLSVATVARTVAAIKEPDSKKQPENKKPVSDFKKPTSEPKKTVPDGKKIVSETKKNTPDAKKNGIDAKKNGIDAKKNGVDAKKNGVDAKKGVLDSKKSALDAKKVVQEVKKQMTEVKKPLQEVRKLTPDVKKTSNELKKPNLEPRRIEPKKPAIEIRKQPVEIKTKLAEIKKVPNETKKTPEGKKLTENKKQQQNDPKKVENGKVNSDVRKPHSVGRKQAEPKKLSVPNMNGHYTNGHGAYDLTRGHLDESGIFKIPRRDEPLNLVKKDKSQPLKLNGGFSPRPDMNVVT